MSRSGNQSDLQPLPTLALGRYRHYKGGEYEVLGVVRHSESLEPMVLYRPLHNASGDWVRPFSMFVGQVEVDGQWQPRFAPVTAPLPANEPVCPLCGGANACEMSARACGKGGAESCWCAGVRFSPDLLARVPADQRNRACICRQCAESA
ncbi:MAG: hypothetical protein RLZZ126_214 [Pseudomonadota bacterium]|jgi:hypothetical protein